MEDTQDEEDGDYADCQECLESFPREELTPRPVIGLVCDNCNREECPECDGTGMDPAPDYDDPEMNSDCDYCGGDGLV